MMERCLISRKSKVEDLPRHPQSTINLQGAPHVDDACDTRSPLIQFAQTRQTLVFWRQKDWANVNDDNILFGQMIYLGFLLCLQLPLLRFIAAIIRVDKSSKYALKENDVTRLWVIRNQIAEPQNTRSLLLNLLSTTQHSPITTNRLDSSLACLSYKQEVVFLVISLRRHENIILVYC